MASIRLSRWDDGTGSSVGWWLVRAVPGLLLMRNQYDGRWLFRLLPRSPYPQGRPDWPMTKLPRQLWGESYGIVQARVLVDHTPALSRSFATRREALEALALVLHPSRSSASALGQMIDA